MKTGPNPARKPRPGYMLTEALVYMGLLFVVLGLGYRAVYSYIDHSMVLRRSAEDISRALNAGERWRSDVRSADAKIRLENTDGGQILYLVGLQGDVAYRFSDGAVSRRCRHWLSLWRDGDRYGSRWLTAPRRPGCDYR